MNANCSGGAVALAGPAFHAGGGVHDLRAMFTYGKDIVRADGYAHGTAVAFFDIQYQGVFKVRVEHEGSLVDKSKYQQQYQTDAKADGHRSDVGEDLFTHAGAGSKGGSAREIQAYEGNTG